MESMHFSMTLSILFHSCFSFLVFQDQEGRTCALVIYVPTNIFFSGERRRGRLIPYSTVLLVLHSLTKKRFTPPLRGN